MCREKSGKASVFQCFYHGWVFGSDGGLRLIPQEGAYPEGYRNDATGGSCRFRGLKHYRGFWFINFDANAMSLSDYLAGAKEYIDNIVDQSEIGMMIIAGRAEFPGRCQLEALARERHGPVPCPQRASRPISNTPPTY